ncbi:fimbrial assembly protein [Bacillus mesophilum]|uniref:Fimbrial assembly protein n=1 Tax=Bacillus mesophilum TaxID=1071718 RepID=A0A7V7RNK3_9BACI|nr:fimbrial assembly protein [Bacillus mesophilum]KAB2334083.1 fimbrial assembly protein [Bacillus mesophilum]
MLVDINLLPQKEKKTKASYIVLLASILIVLIIAAIFFFIIQDRKQSIADTEQQLAQTTELLEAKRAKLENYQSSNSVTDLQNAITWADQQPYNVVYMLQELTKLLPERGFISEFEMNEDHAVNQQVQFDTKSEAAYYLSLLTSVQWIEEAVLTEAQTADLTDQENESAVSDDIVPRYIANYEMRINVPALKEAAQAENDEQDRDQDEGGTSP